MSMHSQGKKVKSNERSNMNIYIIIFPWQRVYETAKLGRLNYVSTQKYSSKVKESDVRFNIRERRTKVNGLDLV